MLISLCIPTYNRCRQLREALDSVFSQPFSDVVEIVISDNASTDGTKEMLRALSDKRIRLIENERNLGAGVNHRTCIENSLGTWVVFLHDDDRLLPDSLGVLCNFLGSITAAAVVLPRSFAFLREGVQLDNALRLLNGISPSSSAYRRDFARQHWPPPENDTCDWEILVTAARYGYEFEYFPFEYIERRLHDHQESKRIIVDGTGNRCKAEFAARLAREIPIRDWNDICARIAKKWTTEELMTLGRFFHHAGASAHYRALQTTAARCKKWNWWSSKGVYILVESIVGPPRANKLLLLFKRAVQFK